jgi:transcriptional regulator with XRE-family HTH domain
VPKSTLDVNALYATLDRKRRDEGVSWRKLADDLDLSPSTFTRMAQGARPDADALATLLDWLKLDLREFSRGELADETDEADLPVAVASLLRANSKVKPEHVKALDEAFAAIYRSIVGQEKD